MKPLKELALVLDLCKNFLKSSKVVGPYVPDEHAPTLNVSMGDWQTRDEARCAIFRYIETWYNPKRRHSTLGYLSPAAYEEQLLEAA